MLPMEQLMPYLNSMFDQELTDKSDIRAYASTSNWDEDGMTPELFDISVNNGNDPKDFVKKKFTEIATNLLYPQQQVFDTQGTARSTQLQAEQIQIRKEQREQEQEEIDSKKPPKITKAQNSANQQVADFYKDKSVWIRTNIGTDTEMQGTELVISPGQENEIRYDLNRKEDNIALIREFSSKPSGQAGVDFDLFVKNAVDKRRAERKKLP